MVFSKDYRVVNVIFVVLEKLAQLWHWLLWWVGLFHQLFVFEIAQISQQYFLASSVLAVHRIEGCQVEKLVWSAVTIEIFVDEGMCVDESKTGQSLFFALMMDFAFISREGLRMFVVVFVGEFPFGKEFFVVGFCLEQLLHQKIKFQKNYFFYTIIISCSTFFGKHLSQSWLKLIKYRWKG